MPAKQRDDRAQNDDLTANSHLHIATFSIGFPFPVTAGLSTDSMVMSRKLLFHHDRPGKSPSIQNNNDF